MTLVIKKPTSGKLVMAKGQPVAVDPLFSQVQLLLHGEGSNGTKTFVDSSPSPKVISLTPAFPYKQEAETQISTTRARFGSSSIRFWYDLTSAITAEINPINIRTSPFTFEAWLWQSANEASKLFGSSANDFYVFSRSGSNLLIGDGVINIINFASSLIPVQQWTHLAFTFDGTTYRVFVDGSLVGSSTTLLKNYSLSRAVIAAKSNLSENVSYLDEIRITASARYTANFTPPTAPFPDF